MTAKLQIAITAPLFEPPRVYGPYDPPPKEGLRCDDPSLTRQSEADSCDINKLMNRYERTGMLPQVTMPGLFMDVTEMGDYRTAIENIRAAEATFGTMPLKIRQRFGNDPAAFLDFCSDPKNRQELEQMGLLAPTTDTTQPAAPAAPAPEAPPKQG